MKPEKYEEFIEEFSESGSALATGNERIRASSWNLLKYFVLTIILNILMLMDPTLTNESISVINVNGAMITLIGLTLISLVWHTWKFHKLTLKSYDSIKKISKYIKKENASLDK